jgi:membrane carboxypeptidase/penicillin-binding protein
MKYMSDALNYLEANPLVARYAWFIPRANGSIESYPYMQLLTKTTPYALSELGKVYVNMSTQDKSIYYPEQQKIPAVVIKAESKYVQAFTKKGDMVDIKNDGLALIQKTLSDKDPKNRKVKPGAIIRVIQKNKQWEVVQLPKVEASLVSMDPQTGAITALVGGFDFNRNKYNHVTQAKRQPGSTFKPFIYSAA